MPSASGAVERAVLRVEIGQRDPSAGHEQLADRPERGARVGEVVQDEEGDRDVEPLGRRRVDEQVVA